VIDEGLLAPAAPVRVDRIETVLVRSAGAVGNRRVLDTHTAEVVTQFERRRGCSGSGRGNLFLSDDDAADEWGRLRANRRGAGVRVVLEQPFVRREPDRSARVDAEILN